MTAEQIAREIRNELWQLGHLNHEKITGEVEGIIAARLAPLVTYFGDLLHDVSEVADEVRFARPDDAYGFSETIRKAHEVMGTWTNSSEQA